MAPDCGPLRPPLEADKLLLDRRLDGPGRLFMDSLFSMAFCREALRTASFKAVALMLRFMVS